MKQKIKIEKKKKRIPLPKQKPKVITSKKTYRREKVKTISTLK